MIRQTELATPDRSIVPPIRLVITPKPRTTLDINFWSPTGVRRTSHPNRMPFYLPVSEPYLRAWRNDLRSIEFPHLHLSYQFSDEVSRTAGFDRYQPPYRQYGYSAMPPTHEGVGLIMTADVRGDTVPLSWLPIPLEIPRCISGYHSVNISTMPVRPAEVHEVQYTYHYSILPISETDIEVNQFEAWNSDHQLQYVYPSQQMTAHDVGVVDPNGECDGNVKSKGEAKGRHTGFTLLKPVPHVRKPKQRSRRGRPTTGQVTTDVRAPVFNSSAEDANILVGGEFYHGSDSSRPLDNSLRRYCSGISRLWNIDPTW
jgi:hypothetical protein